MREGGHDHDTTGTGGRVRPGRQNGRRAGAASGGPISCATFRPMTCCRKKTCCGSRRRQTASWPKPGSTFGTIRRRSTCGARRGAGGRHPCAVRAGDAARGASDSPREFHAARAQSRTQRPDRRAQRGLRPGLRVALRHGSGPGPRFGTLEDFQELHPPRAVLAEFPSFGRHDLRADGRTREQAPPRHGHGPSDAVRPPLHGVGYSRGAGRGFHRHGADRVRCGFRRPELRHSGQCQRQLAAPVGRDHDDQPARLCAGQSGGGHRALHPRRGDGAGDDCRGPGPVTGRNHGRMRADAAGAARRAGDLRQLPVLDVAPFRLAHLRHAGTGHRHRW